jgi:ATP-dependent DNA ligase
LRSPFEPCIPTRATTVPSGTDWLHEIKYDGYRLGLERDGDRFRLITRGGLNWSDRYPWIVEAAHKCASVQSEAALVGGLVRFAGAEVTPGGPKFRSLGCSQLLTNPATAPPLQLQIPSIQAAASALAIR